MANYIFRFYPLQPWFFGGERGFRYGPDAVEYQGNLNYFIKSNLVPQQTTLLGAVKYILLKSQGITIKTDWGYPDEEWKKIVSIAGCGRLDVEGGGDNGFFGAVEEISPLLLSRDDDYWWPVPADHKAGEKNYTPMRYVHNEKARGNFGNVGFLEGYDAKKGLFRGWMKSSNGEVLANEEVFVECTRVGIEIPEQLKKGAGQQEEKSFYKQTYIAFRKQNTGQSRDNCQEPQAESTIGQDKNETPDRFAVFVKLRDGIEIDCKGTTAKFEVMLGGRGGLFVVEVMETEESCYQKLERDYYSRVLEASEQPRIVLVSDALLPYDRLNEIAEYAVYETVDFRPFAVDVSQAPSRARKGEPVKTLSDRSASAYRLLRRGTVIYPEKGCNGQEMDNPVMQRLGYNRKIFIGGERGHA